MTLPDQFLTSALDVQSLDKKLGLTLYLRDEWLNIDFEGGDLREPVDLELLDLQGKCLGKKQLRQEISDQWHLGGLPKGIFILKVKGKEFPGSKKFYNF